MQIVQFVFGLVMIVAALAAVALAVFAICWLILFAFRWLPLVGRRHRHSRWTMLNQSGAQASMKSPPQP